MIKNYLKTVFRNLGKNKVHNLLNIFGLAIGITCAGLIFLWAEDEFAYDSVHVKKKRLYSVEVNMEYDGNVYPWVPRHGCWRMH